MEKRNLFIGIGGVLMVVVCGTLYLVIHTQTRLPTQQEEVLDIPVIAPTQQQQTRNEQRKKDIESISEALARYRADHSAESPTYPPVIYGGEACEDEEYYGDDVSLCAEGKECPGVSLDEYLVPKYLPKIPNDPTVPNPIFSGYSIFRLESDQLMVCATLTEGGYAKAISVTQ